MRVQSLYASVIQYCVTFADDAGQCQRYLRAHCTADSNYQPRRLQQRGPAREQGQAWMSCLMAIGDLLNGVLLAFV